MADLAPKGSTPGRGGGDTKSEKHQCFSAVWVVMPWLCCVLAAVQSRAAPQLWRLSQLSSGGRAQALHVQASAAAAHRLCSTG